MSEIEKAREALVEVFWTRYLSRGASKDDARDGARRDIDLLVNLARAIAREEIEAAKGYKPQPGDRDFDMPGVTPAPKVDAGTGVSAVTTPATGASGFAIPGDPFNQEGGDSHSTGIPNRSDPAEDKSPPAVEAPAAGDPKEMAGRLRNIARDPNNFIPRAGSLIEAAVMIEDTTAIARRLAEALNKIWLSGEPEAHEREVESALTEARKRGLIE